MSQYNLSNQLIQLGFPLVFGQRNERSQFESRYTRAGTRTK